MPDTRDLHEAFARLEQEVPDFYRSPVIADRVAELVNGGDRHGPPVRRGTITSALLAAAAVAAIAVAAVSLAGRSGHNPGVGHQPSTSHSANVSVTPSPQGTTTHASPSMQTSVPNAGSGMPVDSAALIAYVRAGAPVTLSDFQQSEPGPGQAMRPTPGIAEFNTPSGNITCAILGSGDPGGTSVTCEAQQSSFHIPSKPSSCHMDWAGYFGFITNHSVTVGACVGGTEFGPTTQVLAYGSTLQQAGIACRSESGFLACADLTTGRGFAVNRDTLKTY